jgi:hypothetical protein
MIRHILSLLTQTLRVALLLVAVLSLTPAVASAECGDYITIRDATTAAHSDRSKSTDHRLAMPEPGVSRAIGSPLQRSNCSSSPRRQSPPLAPAIPVSSRVKEATQHPLPAHDETTFCSSLACESTSPAPIYRSNSVFHPPRLS